RNGSLNVCSVGSRRSVTNIGDVKVHIRTDQAIFILCRDHQRIANLTVVSIEQQVHSARNGACNGHNLSHYYYRVGSYSYRIEYISGWPDHRTEADSLPLGRKISLLQERRCAYL